MSSTRVIVGLCIVLLAGLAMALPGTAAAQQDQVTLTVSVVDQSDSPLGGVQVTATWENGSRNVTTASNGQALVDVPAGAEVSVQIDDETYVRNRPLVVEEAEGGPVELSVSRSATATVTVVDTAGEPVGDAQVRLIRGAQFVTNQRTDADGRLTTPRVEEGDYDMRVTRAGYYRNQTSVTIAGETNLTSTIESGTALVTFEVTDDHFDEPRPLQNASVRVPGVATVQTGTNNRATVGVPVNDRYEVVVSKPGYQSTSQRVTVGAEATNVTVSTQRTRELSVTPLSQRVVVDESVRLEVVDEYGDPVPNATVGYEGESVSTTGADGTTRVTVPAAGNVSYTVSDGQVSTTVTVTGFDPDATATPAETATTSADTATPTDDGLSFGSGPGFTPVTVAIAVALLSLVALRRR